VKFVFRRAVVGLIALPVFAGAYVLAYGLFGAYTSGLSLTVSEAWANGFMIGTVCVIAFMFSTQLDNLVSKWIGE
jgi:hypothetical protein